MAAQSAFWDRLADKYAAQPVANETAYQTKLETTRRYLRPDMELFEFGAGTGSTALTHAPRVKHIRAIDFSERMMEIAREKADAAGVENVTFETGSIESVELVDRSLDMVLALSILHLLEDHRAAIAKTYRALKPGGLFVSSTACIGETMAWLGWIAPLGKRLGLLPHLNVMGTGQLREAITSAGFVIEHDWQPNPKAALFLIARKPE